PTSPAFVAEEYRYDVVARDQDQDSLQYSLTSAPEGMAINAAGQLRWTPAAAQVGEHPVAVRVSDGRAYVQQSYTLSVVERVAGDTNQYPEIISLPSFSAAVGQTYLYQVVATDADNDPLTYGFINAPEGMSISEQGLVQWVPTDAQVGMHELALYADDGKGKSLQSYSIRVSRDVLPLNVSLTATPEVVQPGERVLINVFASGGQGSITRTLTLNGEALVLNSYGQAEWIASGTGRKTLNATATDGTTTVTDSLPISVATPGDTTPPQVSISAPAFDSVITAPTDVIATVQD